VLTRGSAPGPYWVNWILLISGTMLTGLLLSDLRSQNSHQRSSDMIYVDVWPLATITHTIELWLSCMHHVHIPCMHPWIDHTLLSPLPPPATSVVVNWINLLSTPKHMMASSLHQPSLTNHFHIWEVGNSTYFWFYLDLQRIKCRYHVGDHMSPVLRTLSPRHRLPQLPHITWICHLPGGRAPGCAYSLVVC